MGKIVVNNYVNTKEILKNDHFVAVPIMLETSNGTAVGTKKIVKAGTILPSNDAQAKGVLLYDVDVTNGVETGALVIHGFIDKTKLPAQPEALAESALPMIKFI